MRSYPKLEKVIFSLDYCSRSKCRLCPYRAWNSECKKNLNLDASTLINAMIEGMSKSKLVAPAELSHGKLIAERLDEGCAHWRKNLSEAVSFIVRYKQYATYAIVDSLFDPKRLPSEWLDGFANRKYERNAIFDVRTKEDAMAYSDFLLGRIHTAYKAEAAYEFYKKFEVPLTPKSIEQSADHKTVCVLWQDGSKTIVKLSENDKDDIDTAFAYALAKKVFGTNTHLKKVVRQKLNEHKAKLKKETENATGR